MLLLAVVAAIAGSVAAVAGFGIGSLLTPVLGVAIGTQAAVAVVALPHAVATAVRLRVMRGSVDRRVLMSFGLASAVGGLLGALLHGFVSSPALGAILGVLLVMAGVLEVTGAGRRLRLSPAAARIAGIASGLFGGLVGNQGGIRSAALLRFHLTPQTLVATATATAMLVDLVRLPVYAVTSGPELVENAPRILVMTLGVVVGTVVGAPVLRRLPDRAFLRIIGGTLIVLGFALLAGVGR